MNVTLSDDARRMLASLGVRRGQSRSGVIEELVRDAWGRFLASRETHAFKPAAQDSPSCGFVWAGADGEPLGSCGKDAAEHVPRAAYAKGKK